MNSAQKPTPRGVTSLDGARIPERRARSRKRYGIVLLINHEHVARVLAVKAEIGEAA